MAWENGISDIKDYTKITEKTASLMLEQCQTYLKETNETAKTISTRSDKLITIQIPIVTALLAYLLGNLDRKFDFIQLNAGLIILLVTVSFIWALQSFKKYDIGVPGELPKQIVSARFIDTFKDKTANEQYLNMVLSICEGIQKKIDINLKSNSTRMRYNVISLNILLFIPICPVIAYLLSAVFPQILQ